MTVYDYRVIPAPKRMRRVKGIKTTAELFSMTLGETINAAARDGWEYVRAESLPATEEGGWFRRPVEVVETVLIFRRPRETLGPRVAAARVDAPSAPEAEAVRLGPPERPLSERAALRREPRLSEPEAPPPLRPTPRLGPADQI